MWNDAGLNLIMGYNIYWPDMIFKGAYNLNRYVYNEQCHKNHTSVSTNRDKCFNCFINIQSCNPDAKVKFPRRGMCNN